MKNALAILAVSYAAVVLALFPKWTVDDAFITYRYAENLAHHSELTWNVGEEPVEGYTGVALPVLVAAWIKVGGSAVVAGKLIGVGSFFLAALMLALCLRTLRASRTVCAIALLLHHQEKFVQAIVGRPIFF